MPRQEPITRYAVLEARIGRIRDRTRCLLHALAQPLSGSDPLDRYRPRLLQLEFDHAALAGEQAAILDAGLPTPQFGDEEN